MLARRAAAALLVCGAVLAVAACTSDAGSSASAGRSTPTPSDKAARGDQVLGRPGCRPPSPLTRPNGFPEVHGTATAGSVWALLMLAHRGAARAGDEEKIVWRVTGTGPFVARAIGPDAQHRRPVWGPDMHLGSNWNRPGQEWGTGFVFSSPGCWDLRVRRGATRGDVWVVVAPAR